MAGPALEEATAGPLPERQEQARQLRRQAQRERRREVLRAKALRMRDAMRR